jgi:hypothetical protein
MPSLKWLDGERAKFEATLFEGDFSFYVDAALLDQCRTRGATMSNAEWKRIFDEGGFVAQLGIAYGPREMALAYLSELVKKYPDSYFSWAGALARFELDVFPLVLEQARAHPEKALDDLAPIDAPEIAEIVEKVLASKAGSNSKVKRKAKSWLARHRPDAKKIKRAASPR